MAYCWNSTPGWWQTRREHSLSFVEDDELRPGEDVTSSSRRTKITKFRWNIRKVRFKMADPTGTENRKRSKKNAQRRPHPVRKRTSRNRSIREIAVWCHLPRKTSQLPAEPGEWPNRLKNSEVCIFCMCHLTGQRLADTDAWCFLNLLYRICGLCRYSVMFDPIFVILDVNNLIKMYFS